MQVCGLSHVDLRSVCVCGRGGESTDHITIDEQRCFTLSFQSGNYLMGIAMTTLEDVMLFRTEIRATFPL